MTYMPWARANMDAATRKAERVELNLDGKAYEQITQHYAARAYQAVVKAVDEAKDAEGLDAFLDNAGAKPHLG